MAGYRIKSWILCDRVAKAVTALGDDRALKFYDKSDKGKADFTRRRCS